MAFYIWIILVAALTLKSSLDTAEGPTREKRLHKWYYRPATHATPVSTTPAPKPPAPPINQASLVTKNAQQSSRLQKILRLPESESETDEASGKEATTATGRSDKKKNELDGPQFRVDDTALSNSQSRFVEREKRGVRRENWTDAKWAAFESSRRVELYDYDIHVFRLNVHEAANLRSICNYSVIPIPNPGGRVPDKLDHIQCNYVGNYCHHPGTYWCVQLYNTIDVTYYGNVTDTIELKTGCSCMLVHLGSYPQYNPPLPIND